ncbi:M14 family metallopeptidase [Streptomyces smaragdinus]|uniref:M14 family metallopeptidase n=1 Tax=Streptomyces smaragdinus TaxID=2585196 RepID=UPI00389ABCC4
MARPRARNTALVLAAAAVLIGINPSAPASARIPPRTGFEQRAGSSWTTEAEETSFLTTVRQRSSRVAVERIGTTRKGRPLRLVRVGEPRENVLLLICSQHGDEPAGREACLTTIRDLAFGEDPATRRLLARTTVLVVPTANPDGLAAGTRGNSENADINRDHIVLRTAEARAIAAVLRDRQPDIVYDLHEFLGDEPYYTRDLLTLWPRHPGVDPAVRAASKSLARTDVRAAAERAGFTTGDYGIWIDPRTGVPVRQVAGDGQERILRNTVGLKHALGVLAETRVNPAPPGPATNRRRVRAQLTALHGALAFTTRNVTAVEAATTAARAGDGGTGPLAVGGADNAPPRRGETITDLPCGYRLDPTEYARASERLALHGIEVHPRKDGAFVPLRQPLRSLVPLLLDARAAHPLAAAVPLRRCP